jgi:hypothetical protein
MGWVKRLQLAQSIVTLAGAAVDLYAKIRKKLFLSAAAGEGSPATPCDHRWILVHGEGKKHADGTHCACKPALQCFECGEIFTYGEEDGFYERRDR